MCLGSCQEDDICNVGQINPSNECEICKVNFWGTADYYPRYDGCCFQGKYFPIGTINPDNECEYCRFPIDDTWEPRQGCCINTIFYEPGTKNHDNECETCDPDKDTQAWTIIEGC